MTKSVLLLLRWANKFFNMQSLFRLALSIATICMLISCSHQPAPANIISEAAIRQLTTDLSVDYYPSDKLERGIRQAAALWRIEDGTEQEFVTFVTENFAQKPEDREALFNSLCRLLENLSESSDMLTVELLKPTQLTNAGEPTTIDWLMSGYNPSAHLTDDLFANKVAFITILNFPHFSLSEKNILGATWTRREWAEARLGDVFTQRIPAREQTQMAEALAAAENYIADYNIFMGRLRTEDDRQLFPDEMCLLSHWNLRDELKANYSGNDGQEKQEMIYQVMLHIVKQDIPAAVINNKAPIWYPHNNRVIGAEAVAEADCRYQHILDIFHAMQLIDKYCPDEPTAIERCFEQDIEMSASEIDSLFRSLLASPQVLIVADEIRQRLGRDLRPYDIWYDGFKVRSTMNEDALTQQTQQLFPTPDAYERQIPSMLTRLGFSMSDAQDIASHIVVEPARGSGHAWPSLGHNEPTRLRTRIAKTGMDYKGYNIAVHEMGHNLEEVISLYRMDFYPLHGIPNTGFTEASAFLFQRRDLELLGYGKQPLDRNAVLDAFWGMYEIMGVSLVDMQIWQWLYAHPTSDAAALRQATLSIAAAVWNEYFYPVLGEKDCPLLAIYSHIVNSPMYLPNYPIGHIVQFQLEEHLAKLNPSEWAQEYERCYRLGRLAPNEWMRQATGGSLSIEPLLRQVR